MTTDQNFQFTEGSPHTASAVALSNAITLVIGVFQGIVNKDVAATVNGETMMSTQIASLANARITEALIKRFDQAKVMGIVK